MKVAGFQKKDADAPKQLALQAPIPLKGNMTNDEFGDGVKYKLRRNPSEADSERYTATFRS